MIPDANPGRVCGNAPVDRGPSTRHFVADRPARRPGALDSRVPAHARGEARAPREAMPADDAVLPPAGLWGPAIRPRGVLGHPDVALHVVQTRLTTLAPRRRRGLLSPSAVLCVFAH